MSVNAMVDVAIGLILMYLVLSLVCTAVNEFLAGVLKLRAAKLRQGIEDLIDNDQLRATFDDHGLIAGTRAALKGRDPSYMSGRTFAAALLDSLDPNKPLLSLDDVRKAADRLPASNIKDAILGAFTERVQTLEGLRNNVAAWFDDTMDRLSGSYKRWLQLISLLVGLAIAVALNADSWTVASALWSDAALRGQMAAAAGKIVEDAGKAGTTPTAESLGKNLKDLRDQLQPLPIGWTDAPGRPDHQWYDNWHGRLSKLFGWLFTGFAVMLGAPFWFDLLSRFVQLRSSGEKPKSSA
ncbi:MAG TPA: hypothetical protein VMV26_12535 [Alphaproteobacteria bacterium]|jgi:hypothetical protein|nr:hypothetical protein [Alphaproteobacteria bacterium]